MKKLTRYLIANVFIILSSLIIVNKSLADDIDSYRLPPPEPVSNNMLFVLDQSGSMGWNARTGEVKLSILKDAMKYLLNLSGMQQNRVAVMGYTTAANDGNKAWLNPFGQFDLLSNTTYKNSLLSSVDQMQALYGTPSGPAIYYALRWMANGLDNDQTSDLYQKSPSYIRTTNLVSDSLLTSPMNKENYCADNRVIFLSDGNPYSGIKLGNNGQSAHLKLRSLPENDTLNGKSLELTRPLETEYVRDVYFPAYNLPTSPFAASTYRQYYSPDFVNKLRGNDPEGVNGYNYIRFISDLQSLTNNTSTVSLQVSSKIAEESASKKYCNPAAKMVGVDSLYASNFVYYPSNYTLYRRPTICLPDLVTFASNTDFRTGADFPNVISGEYPNGKPQSIIVDTIGFDVETGSDADRSMRQTAALGGGKYYPADNRDQLREAFRSISESSKVSVDFAYNAPAIPVDLSDPTAVGTEIYLPLFEPSLQKIWPGNLNKYNFTSSVSTESYTVLEGTSVVTKTRTVERIQIRGQQNKPALTQTGSLAKNTQDLWSNSDSYDGSDIKTGGVASLLNAKVGRKIYTEDTAAGNGLKLLSAANTVNNASLYQTVLSSEYFFCNDWFCVENASAQNSFAYRVTDDQISTTLWSNKSYPLSASNYNAYQQGINGITLQLDSLATAIYPSTIKIIMDTDPAHIRMMGDSYKLVLTSSDNRTITADADLKSGNFTYDISDTSFDVRSLRLTCDINCPRLQQLPVAEIQVLAPEADVNWFLNTPLNQQEISNSVTKIGAPIHTKPIVITDALSSNVTIYLPTSEGVLHAFDAQTGEELWGFMPTELVGNIAILRNNDVLSNAATPEYGLDGQPFYFNIKESGGFSRDILVFGMRRGGQSYYALDITNRNNPKLLWKIDPTMADFAHLGQTWAQPYPAPVALNGSETVSLVFGGGYDGNSDTNRNRLERADTVGNRIYFVDALNPRADKQGRLLAVVTDDSPTENFSNDVVKVELPGLKYGIVTIPAHIDYDTDAYYDRFYFADTGGQIIRIDMTDDQLSPINAAILADLGGDDEQNYIRFFNPPTVAKEVIDGREIATIAIGSGNRPNLSDKSTVDRFYSVRDKSPYSKEFTFPQIKESTMYDATMDIFQDPNASTVAVTNANNELRSKDGWYIRLTSTISSESGSTSTATTTSSTTGEKVLNRARVFRGIVYFSTYTLEENSADKCNYSAGQSTTRFYAISLSNGAAVFPYFDESDNSTAPRIGDRYVAQQNTGGGIPSEIAFYTVSSGDGSGGVDVVIGTDINGEKIRVQLDSKLTATSWEVLAK